MIYKLSPSDFSFLYGGCKRCFYLKVMHNIQQPSIPLPSIFTQMADLLVNYYNGKRTSKLHIALPSGIVRYGERYVESKVIQIEGYNAKCFIRGRFDIAIEFDDGTYAVVDFKTGSPSEEHVKLYSRQLHAYAFALENPARGAMSLSPVTKLGLLYFHPSKVSQQESEWLSYDAEIIWVEVQKDYKEFERFIKEVLGLLDGRCPEFSPDCRWCQYIRRFQCLGA